MPKVGSAVIFWHEHYGDVHHPFPASFVHAVSLDDLRLPDPRYQPDERMICKALVLGRPFPCMILTVEPGRSLDEQAAIVLRDRQHLEERGRRWTAALKAGRGADRNEVSDDGGEEDESASEEESDEEMENVGGQTVQMIQAAPSTSPLPTTSQPSARRNMNISSPFKHNGPPPTKSQPNPRRIPVALDKLNKLLHTPMSKHVHRGVSEPNPNGNEDSDGGSEDEDDEEDNVAAGPRGRSMVSTIHSKKAPANVSRKPAARKRGPAKKGRRVMAIAPSSGVKQYPVAIPGADGAMVNLENLVGRMAVHAKLKAFRIAMTEVFPEDELQHCVVSMRGKKADSRLFDKHKLDALFEVYREYARRSGMFGRLPDRKDFGQMCSRVKMEARKKGGLPAMRSGQKSHKTATLPVAPVDMDAE